MERSTILIPIAMIALAIVILVGLKAAFGEDGVVVWRKKEWIYHVILLELQYSNWLLKTTRKPY